MKRGEAKRDFANYGSWVCVYMYMFMLYAGWDGTFFLLSFGELFALVFVFFLSFLFLFGRKGVWDVLFWDMGMGMGMGTGEFSSTYGWRGGLID